MRGVERAQVPLPDMILFFFAVQTERTRDRKNSKNSKKTSARQTWGVDLLTSIQQTKLKIIIKKKTLLICISKRNCEHQDVYETHASKTVREAHALQEAGYT